MNIEQQRAIAMASARARMAQQAQPSPQPAEAPTAEPIGRLGRIARGGEDVLDAGAQMLVNALPEKLVSGVNKLMGDKLAPTAQQFNANQAQEERDYQGRRKAAGSEGFDGYRALGNIGATLPLAPLLPGAGVSMGGAVASGAATGGVMGALQPVTDDSQSYGEQKLGQVGTGAATGAVLGPLMNLIGKFVSPKVDPDVKFLRDRGVTPTMGQMLGKTGATAEAKATSIPVLGDYIAGAQQRTIKDFNKAAYNEALKPIGETFKGEAGHSGVASVQARLGKAYDELLSKMTFKADQQFMQDFQGVTGMAQYLTPDKAKQFSTIMKNEVAPRLAPNGMMDGKSVKVLENELGGFIKKFGSSSSADDHMLADALGEVLRSVRATLERSNPAQAARLGDINKGWAMYARIRDAASRAGALKNEGVFTPEALYAAVRSGDKSAGRGATAGGKALMQDLAKAGTNVIGSKYPDSGTAGRLLGPGILGLGVVSPGAGMAAAAGVAPYTSMGQRATAALLADRPNVAPQIAAAVRKATLPTNAALASLLIGKPNPGSPNAK
jgi:hypothetical protein